MIKVILIVVIGALLSYVISVLAGINLPFSRNKSLILFGSFAAILVVLSILIQLPEPIQNIESLPNGKYFYGAALKPNQEASTYYIFQKYGPIVTGFRFSNIATDSYPCFKGRLSLNSLYVYTYADAGEVMGDDPGKTPPIHKVEKPEPRDLSGFRSFSFDKAPPKLIAELPECVESLKSQPPSL